MEWSEMQHVVLPVLDALSMVWIVSWLVTSLAARNAAERSAVPVDEPAAERTVDQAHESSAVFALLEFCDRLRDQTLSNEQLALLESNHKVSQDRERWM